MRTLAKHESRSFNSPLVVWIGRAVGVGAVVLGLVTLYGVFEVESNQVPLYLFLTVLALLGGLLFLYGLQRPALRSSAVARVIGWLMMAGYAVFPGMVWFLWVPCVLLGLPAVFVSRRAS